MTDHARSAARRHFRPRVDSLESRQLLSADGPLAGNAEIDRLVGASLVRQLHGVDGSGLAAAVIDTGVNYRHAALGGGFGPGETVVDGYDFGDRDADPDASTWDHGTAVAGLIAGGDPAAPGVAPGAKIVALRVFDSSNRGDYGWVADALQWVIDHHDEDDISVVNLSISDSRNYALNWFSEDGGIGERISGLIDQLRARNIPVVSAAGNSFGGQPGMGFTAILPQTISVTATDAADAFVKDAQRLGTGKSATDLAAPGSGLTAPTGSGGFSTVEGTSFAAPLVSGSILLLQQLYRERFGTLPTVDQLESWLEAGADPVRDPVTGITLGRLDLAGAAALVPPAPKVEAPPAAIPPAPPTPDATPVAPTPPAAVPVGPVTAVYRGGALVGAVSADGPANPLRDAAARFGARGTARTVHVRAAQGRRNAAATARAAEARREALARRAAAVPRGPMPRTARPPLGGPASRLG
jgi:type VI secretion system secreted protein VgrG